MNSSRLWNVIYDQPFDKSLLRKIEAIQYNAVLA